MHAGRRLFARPAAPLDRALAAPRRRKAAPGFAALSLARLSYPPSSPTISAVSLSKASISSSVPMLMRK